MKCHLAGIATVLVLAAVAIRADEPKAHPKSDSPAVKPDASKEGLPKFDSDGALIVPEGYREWVFVGSSIGLGYKETEQPKVGRFSHVYINPFGYRAFRDTGEFPVGTVLMLEAVSRGEKTNLALAGYYSNNFTGLEAAVKTGDRFEDTWSYYNFFTEDRKQLPKGV